MGRSIETIITPKPRDLGDATVRRALPAPDSAAVGPFVFFDEMGPAEFDAGTGLDVRPHPHIGLATVTLLFEGEILHRDSLGTIQAIRPGEVNWMVAGRGIVHSERTAARRRHSAHRLHGIQTWLALPRDREADPPAFAHHSSESLTSLDLDGARLRIIAGTAFGASSPVAVLAPTLYVEVELAAGAELVIPDEHQERGLYLIRGKLTIDDQVVEAGAMAVFVPGVLVTVAAVAPCHAVLIGGAALDGRRHLWWNLVASQRSEIERARVDWQSSIGSGFTGSRFALPPDEHEYIPLPD